MAHILLIDDESGLREILAQALTAAGHTVTEAENGHLAVECLHTESFDLVITDLVMPEQDGIETIMTLRYQFPSVPVIAMSGAPRNAPLYLQIATNLGVRRALEKPFRMETLLNAVDHTLERTCVA